jgi:hypothetical protein
MSTHPNIKSQLDTILNKLDARGESKYDAKIAYRKSCASNGEKWNPSKTPFVHSNNTVSGYRQTIKEFSHWLKENENNIYASKDLSKVDKEICYNYLKSREDEGKSAWTLGKDQSALNKVLDLGLNRKECGLKIKEDKDVVRSRVPREMDTRYNSDNYKEPIEFAKAFGLRRECIKGGTYEVKESSLFKRADKVYCSTIGKGGKYREAVCLDKYKDIMLEKYNIQERESIEKEDFKTIYRADKSEPLFPKYTTLIDNHAFRGQYARDLYTELAEQKEAEGIPYGQKYYHGYYSDCVREVSNSLGHNRLSVVIISYFK